MKKNLFLVLLGILFIFSSCSTYLTSSENVSKVKHSYDKILVVGRSKDKTARFKFENKVVDKLKQNGVNAKASHALGLTNDLDKKLSETEVARLKNDLMSNGFDGAVITNLINTEEYTDVIPGNTSTAYIPTRYGRFGRFYGYYPITTWEPDQLKTGTKYILESSLYQIKSDPGDNLQWVGRFELKDPSSLEKTTENYANDLVSALLKESVMGTE